MLLVSQNNGFTPKLHQSTWLDLQAVPLAAVVLRALGCGHHGAAKAAIEYLDWLSSVPVAERHPQLGQPVFISMLPHLLELASYPAGFTTWEESPDGDSNTFHSFRWGASPHAAGTLL